MKFSDVQQSTNESVRLPKEKWHFEKEVFKAPKSLCMSFEDL